MDIDLKIVTDKGTFNFTWWIDKHFRQNSEVHSFMDDVEWEVIHDRFFDRLPEEYKLIDYSYSFEAFEYD